MEKPVQLVCATCGKVFDKPAKEYRRRIKEGHTKFFCSISCGAISSNKERKAKTIEKICPVCGKTFTTVSNKSERTFCSQSCASKGSMTPKRKRAQRLWGIRNKNNLLIANSTLKSTSALLRQREGWKYAKIDKTLSLRPHEFEYPLEGKYIFDLALLDVNILVEFDGPDHRNQYQKDIDREKDAFAESYGFEVVHRDVAPASVIPLSAIKGL